MPRSWYRYVVVVGVLIMRYLQETTDWSDTDYDVKNHIYILENGRSGRMLGYVKQGTTEKIMFDRPFFFNRKNRKFKELKNVI